MGWHATATCLIAQLVSICRRFSGLLLWLDIKTNAMQHLKNHALLPVMWTQSRRSSTMRSSLSVPGKNLLRGKLCNVTS